MVKRALSGRAIAAVALLLGSAGVALGAEEAGKKDLVIPDPDVGVDTLASRGEAQRSRAGAIAARHDFRFTDRQPESGITFRNLITEDNRANFKATHYDHGNGVAVADVDGDGRHDLYFVTQLGSNELWRNLGDGRFENVTEAAGVGLEDRIGVTASFADYDNDGDPDLFVTTVKMGNVLFENDGKGRFKDVSDAAGVAAGGHSSGSFFFDYNNDGLLDLFVTNVGVYTNDEQGPGGYYLGLPDAFSGHLFPERTEYSLLFENQGDKTFREVSEAVGLVDGGWSGDATFVDLDGDRYPEVYVLSMQGDDQYWVNSAGDDGRRFSEATAGLFPRTSWGAMGVKFFDYNNDGRMDLYVTDMHSDMSREVGPPEEKLKSIVTWTEKYIQDRSNNIFGNSFYENRGEDGFVEVSDPLGVENYWPWGFTAADLNADGFEDLFVASSMSFPFRYGVNSVFLNSQGNRFFDAEFILGVEPRREGLARIPWFDLDCSGLDSGHASCEDREGSFQVVGTLGTRSSVAFDLEGDGDLDVVTNEFYYVPQVLVSDLADSGSIRFLNVDLVGTRSNRDGLGALVRVVCGGDAYTKYHDGKSGYLSQSSQPLYFGLGEAESVDRIEVLWPSGIEQTVTTGLEINSTVVVTEPSEAESGG